MRRLVPHPLLSAALALMWLMLTRFSLGHLLLGTALGLFAGWTFARLAPEGPRFRNPGALVRLAGRVAVDIVRSNLAVARLIVAPGAPRASGFVDVPLRLTDPVPLAFLAMIVTATPGTAWIRFDRASGVLKLHLLDLADGATVRRQIAERYESLLLEAWS